MKINKFGIKSLIGAFLTGVCTVTSIVNILSFNSIMLGSTLLGIVGGVGLILSGMID